MAMFVKCVWMCEIVLGNGVEESSVEYLWARSKK